MIGADELVEVFRAETREQLEQILELLDGGEDQWDIRRLLGLFHNVKGAAAIVGAEEIRIVAHGAEDMLSRRSEGVTLTPELAEVVRTGAKLIDALLGESPPSAEALFSFAEQVALHEDPTPGPEPDESSADEDPGEARPEVRPEARPEAPPEPDAQTPAPAVTSQPRASTLRVASSKIDGLVGLAAEFIIHTMDADGQASDARRVFQQLRSVATRDPELRARLSDPLRELAKLCEALVEAAGRSQRISNELNVAVRGLRMVRLDSLHGVLSRVVRESCEATGNRARLEFAPGATELDRELLDQLRDPLVHLLRNAVAHGVEDPRERARASKPEVGRISLTARSAGPWIEISIADDGRGISAAEIGERAVEQGLISTDELAGLSEAERLALVFMARLSTQKTPNLIAGRGVGLDVVRSRVHGCGGRISIHSELGRGTIFELRVPLTRATTRGVIVETAGQRYVLPALHVERVFIPAASDLGRLEGKEVVSTGGENLGVTDLQALLGLAARPISGRPVVVLGHGHRRRGVVVDDVLEEREFVLQGLGWNLEAVRGVAGSAVLDGGDVLLVLDAPALIDGLEVGGLTSLEAPSTRQRRILVVDDSVTSRTLEKNILASAGYEVLLAVDGIDAWSLLESEAIDLVISDVEMPNMNGLALTRKIREVERHASLPVILVTSRGGPEDRLAGAEAGADAYVVKGAFDQDELLRAVARLL
jgi:two-component system, chemotaxis family, sensor kinase CheA